MVVVVVDAVVDDWARVEGNRTPAVTGAAADAAVVVLLSSIVYPI